MTRTTRRTFLQQISAATAAGLLLPISDRRLWAMTADDLLPPPDEPLLRSLALNAMDVAKTAGATFADIRLTAGRFVGVGGVRFGLTAPVEMGISLAYPTAFGIRAIVDGAWGFAGGTELTVDAVVRTARTAVAIARANKPRRRRTLELASLTPVRNGEWATPIVQEPLDVPLGEQGDLAMAAVEEAFKVEDVLMATTIFEWRRPTTVFASTDGSLITQRYACASINGSVTARGGPGVGDHAGLFVPGMRSGGYGYEALEGRRIITEMRKTAEQALVVARESAKSTPVEVGRYDIVFGVDAMASLLTSTLARALAAERVLGYQANRGGTSFAAPPAEVLGKLQIAAPIITVRGDRSRPGGGATVGWDDEGVAPEPYTFVDKGLLVDYHTTRETAAQLGGWYQSRGEPVRSHGCAQAAGSDLPQGRLPNLTLEPASDDTTVDDLIKSVKKGLYIERSADTSIDHQILSVQARVDRWNVRYIRNGKLGGYVHDTGLQFITPALWKSIDALGGRPSVAVLPMKIGRADPIQPLPFSTIEVTPARVPQVNILNLGRTG